MKKKIVVSASVCLLLVLIVLSAPFIMSISASTTHHVYPGQSIQEAINSAQHGDTVLVHNGTYIEDVVVNKSISLIGENKENTIVYGSGNGTVIYVFADNVNISRFTIMNSGNFLSLSATRRFPKRCLHERPTIQMMWNISQSFRNQTSSCIYCNLQWE